MPDTPALPGSGVIAWPKVPGVPVEVPRPIKRPCDYGLELAIANAEIQLGTVEAYNRLVAAAAEMRARITAGDIRPQNPLYAVDIKGG